MSSDASGRQESRPSPWLERRLPAWQCVLGWVLASCVFVSITAFLGGPTQADASEALYSTWAVAHGELHCMDTAPTPQHVLPDYQPGAPIPPLWPLVSGGIAALFRIGHAVPFPSESSFGANCAHVYAQMFKWAESAIPVQPTLAIAYVSWLVLLAAVVVFLRAVGRGRTVWEPATLLLLAATPTVWMPMMRFFHPQDLMAVGLAVMGMGLVKREHWVWAGVAFGLALTAQQFALLILLPVVIVVSGVARWRLIGGTVAAWLAVIVPVIALTSGQGFDSAIFGTGNTSFPGGTLVWELRITGAPLVIVSRILPLVFAAALGLWAHRKLGPRALEPVPFTALVALSLTMRLVFEHSLFGYYFMALTVLLVLLDVVRGRIRAGLIVWILLITFAYNPVPWGVIYNARSYGEPLMETTPLILLGVIFLMMVWDALHRRLRWYLPTAFVLMLASMGHWPWTIVPVYPWTPNWLTQIVLVGGGLALAGGPFLASVRAQDIESDAGESRGQASVSTAVE